MIWWIFLVRYVSTLDKEKLGTEETGGCSPIQAWTDEVMDMVVDVVWRRVKFKNILEGE